jgi:hypothetical protein
MMRVLFIGTRFSDLNTSVALVEIVELAAPFTLATGTPPLLALPDALLPLG